jgi:predicted component of type VI protein secretion system
MALLLKITSDHRKVLGDDCERAFDGKGGIIGRSLQADWILPDPDRFISGRHAAIDFKGGMYYLADTSSNGVYVNDDSEPLGKGNPRRLFDGDKLRMGDFEFLVSIENGESLVMPPEEPTTVIPEDVGLQVAEEPLKSGIQMLDAEEITGDEEFQATLFGGRIEDAKTQANGEMVDQQQNPFTAPEEPKELSPADLVDALFEGMGISRSEIHPSVDALDVMRNAGNVLNEFITGIADLLKSRSSFKTVFRLEQTTTLPRHNNPLKLSEDVRTSVKQLLIGEEGEYLGPVDSVKEVCRDLRFHHDAMLAAMNISLVEIANRFDPEELQENFDRTFKKKSLFPIMDQLRYWRLYCDLYPIITQRGSGEFPHLFGEEFVREYENQIAEFMRTDRTLAKRDTSSFAAKVQPDVREEKPQDQSIEARAKPLV